MIKRGEGIPEDLARQGEAATEVSMSAEMTELTDKGFEEVTDAELLGKVQMTPPDAVVENWDAYLGDLKDDPDFDYKIVVDESGTSEVMKGKPAFKLFRKPKEQTE